MIYEKLHIFKAYSLESSDLCILSWNHHYNQGNRHIHHLQSLLLPLCAFFFFFFFFFFVVKTLNMKVSNMDHGVFEGWTIETCCRGKWRPHNKWPGPVDIKNYHYANDGIKLMCFFLVCLKKSCGLMRSIRQ